MTKFKKQLISVLATGAVFASMITPAIASEIVVTDNYGYSKVDLDVNNTTNVAQNNVANINNSINSSASSGGNDANKNNADTTIKTGDVNTNTTVNNVVNSNKAEVACCVNNNLTVNLDHNYGTTKAYVDLNTTTDVLQNNVANINNDVDTRGSSGGNDANKNNGNTTIVTGDVNASANVYTKANANVAKVGGNGGAGGSINIVAKDNYGYSKVDLDINRDNFVQQLNVANINNDVDVKASSGYNDAYKNNGDVWVQTGDATAKTVVDNQVNFNAADVNCGCVLDDLFIKLGHNNGKSKVYVDLTGDTGALQNNVANLLNDIDAKAKTGYNDANKNNGGGQPGDPVVIVTGDATDWQTVNNKGNENWFGSGTPFSWPWSSSNFNFNVTFNLAELLAMLQVS